MQNLLTVIKALEKIGASLPNVNTVILSDIYQLNSLPNIDYSVFAIVQDQHRKDDNFTYLGFYLYYVDRLLNDRSNQIEIQSHGLEILSEVIDKIEDLGLILSPEFDRVLQPFNQRFSDECAGIYCRLEIMIPQDCMIAYDILVNPKLANLAVYQPGTYYPSDYGADGFRVVDVSGQSYQYYTENEADKTARIDNGYHNIVVDESGVTIDGQNNNKNIADLSGITSALTEQIGQLSGLTDDFVRKVPTESSEIVNLNDLVETGYYYISGHKSTGGPIWDNWADAMLHVIKRIGSYDVDTIVQYYTTTVHESSRDWPRTYFRTRGWDMTQSAVTWSKWQEVATDSLAMMRQPENIDHAIDFNDYIKSGYYCLKREFHNQNGPIPEEELTGSGILEVVMRYDEEDGFQRFTTTRNQKIYFRAFGWDDATQENIWKDWYQITLTPVQQ